MSSLYINGKEIPEYTLFPDDTNFKEIGYSGFPKAFRETVKKLLEGKTINKIGKYYLNGEEAYIYQDPVLKDYFNNIGYSNTEVVTNVDYYYWDDAFVYAEEIQENWDSSRTSLQSRFRNNQHLVFMPMVDTSNVTDMGQCFEKCYNLTTIPKLDTSNVTDMSYCFHYCYYLSTIPKLDTSNVTDMSYCFYNCYSLITIPELDTGKVTNMSECFGGCYSLTTIPKLDTSNVTNMYGCFWDCSELTSIPKLDTSNVTNMSHCFSNCRGLTSIPELDTSNVTDMERCFNGCSELTSIPELDTGKVTSMRECFYGCSELTSIPELDTGKVTDMYNCFYKCDKLKRVEGISFKSMGSISSSEDFFFETFPNTSLRYLLIKDIGTNPACTYLNCSYARAWGINSEDVPDAGQSLRDSLLTYSFDRASAGYSNCTIRIWNHAIASLTVDDINQIEAKGYKIYYL